MENTPTLLTNRLILRQFVREDLPALFSILSDPEVNTFLPWFTHQSMEETLSFLQILSYKQIFWKPILALLDIATRSA